MNWGKCHRCGEYQIHPHLCQCRLFLCWYDGTQDQADEAHQIYAQSQAEAAEKLAHEWVREEYTCPDLTIWVRPLDGGSLQPFLAEPEMKLEYHAHPIAVEEVAV